MELQSILSSFNSLTGAGTSQSGQTEINPLDVFRELSSVVGGGFIGDIIGAAAEPDGALSAGRPNFGNIANTALNGALAGLGPLGAIASSFLGSRGDSDGGPLAAIGEGLSNIGRAIGGAIENVVDAVTGGNRSERRSSRGRSGTGASTSTTEGRGSRESGGGATEASSGSGSTSESSGSGSSGGSGDSGGSDSESRS